MSAILFSPSIGPVPISVFLSERHESELEITEVPIEGSANASDHAYSMPDRVLIEIADEGGAITFQMLRDWQKARVPFELVTGFEVYSNMLIKSIRPVRDKEFSTVLRAQVELQEVIIVETSYVAAGDSAFSATPGQPGGQNSLNAASLSSSRALGADAHIRASRTATGGISTTSLAPTAPGVLGASVNTPAQNLAILAQVFG